MRPMLSMFANVTLPSARELTAFGPEFLAVATVVLVLLLPLFLPRRSLPGLIPAVTALGGIYAPSWPPRSISPRATARGCSAGRSAGCW